LKRKSSAYFGLLPETEIAPNIQEQVQEQVKFNDLLNKSINELNLSKRPYNVLAALKITTLEELVQYSAKELLSFRPFGVKCLEEVEAALALYNLTLQK